MQEQVKMFTFVSNHGQTLVEPPYENHINAWLRSIDAKFIKVTQSESARVDGSHHVTCCIWYLPNKNENKT